MQFCTCGELIGNKPSEFLAAKYELMSKYKINNINQKNKKYDEEYLKLISKYAINMCCRTHLITYVDISQIVK